MNIDISRNYFELFGFAESFDIDQDTLADKYLLFQSALHPDRFANASDRERRIAVQSTAFINEAYTTLKSDLKRAHYLLKLKDIEFNADTETSGDAEFLVRQMELHERAEAADEASDPIVALEEVSQELKRQRVQLISEFSAQYAEGSLASAKDTALKLQFYERLTRQIKQQQGKYQEELL